MLEGFLMIRWVVLFLIISLVAGALGYSNIAQGAADIAKFIFFGFLILFIIALVLLFTGK